LRDRWLGPPALLFFNVLLRHRLIYISVPKCALTTIKSPLGALELGLAPPPDKVHTRRYSGLKSPTQVGLSAFRRLANSAATLQFAFVRNPDARLVSAWADKFQIDRPCPPHMANPLEMHWIGARARAIVRPRPRTRTT
jgi:hypothetical protein